MIYRSHECTNAQKGKGVQGKIGAGEQTRVTSGLGAAYHVDGAIEFRYRVFGDIDDSCV